MSEAAIQRRPATTDDPEYVEMLKECEPLYERLKSLHLRAGKNGYWAASARQHLLNFEAAYRRAFHELPAKPADPVILEDLF